MFNSFILLIHQEIAFNMKFRILNKGIWASFFKKHFITHPSSEMFRLVPLQIWFQQKKTLVVARFGLKLFIRLCNAVGFAWFWNIFNSACS